MMKPFLVFLFAMGLVHAQDSGSALSFDGTDDYVDLVAGEPNLPFGNQSRTVEAWVYLESTDYFTVLEYGRNTSGRRYTFGINNSNGTAGNIFLAYNGHSYGVNANVVPLNQWTHVAAVIPAGATQSNDGIVYVNGVALPQTSIIGSVQTINTQTSGRAYVGRNLIGTNYAGGSIDEVRIWNRALSQDEIRHKMAERLSGSEPGLVAYYRMDEGADNTCSGGEDVCDATGNGNHGTKF